MIAKLGCLCLPLALRFALTPLLCLLLGSLLLLSFAFAPLLLFLLGALPPFKPFRFGFLVLLAFALLYLLVALLDASRVKALSGSPVLGWKPALSKNS